MRTAIIEGAQLPVIGSQSEHMPACYPDSQLALGWKIGLSDQCVPALGHFDGFPGQVIVGGSAYPVANGIEVMPKTLLALPPLDFWLGWRGDAPPLILVATRLSEPDHAQSETEFAPHSGGEPAPRRDARQSGCALHRSPRPADGAVRSAATSASAARRASAKELWAWEFDYKVANRAHKDNAYLAGQFGSGAGGIFEQDDTDVCEGAPRSARAPGSGRLKKPGLHIAQGTQGY